MDRPVRDVPSRQEERVCLLLPFANAEADICDEETAEGEKKDEVNLREFAHRFSAAIWRDSHLFALQKHL